MTTANDIITYLRTHLSDLSPDEMAMVRPYLAEYGEGEGDMYMRLFGGLCEHLKSEMDECELGWPWERGADPVVPTADGRGHVTYTMRYLRTSTRPILMFLATIKHPGEQDGARGIRFNLTPLHVLAGADPNLWCLVEREAGRTWIHEVLARGGVTSKMFLLLTETRAAESGDAYTQPNIEEGPEEDPDDAPF